MEPSKFVNRGFLSFVDDILSPLHQKNIDIVSEFVSKNFSHQHYALHFCLPESSDPEKLHKVEVTATVVHTVETTQIRDFQFQGESYNTFVDLKSAVHEFCNNL